MAATGDLIDFEIIEGQKENIQSIPSGRSARALANLYSVSPLQPQLTPLPSDTTNLNDATRREYEEELVSMSESDDPLDIFDRYVKWTMDAYPSSQATKESQLLPLLERATKTFLNNAQYKNDPRYLKLWLTYIRLFSDAPRETFAFLARHSIGDALALFYEEFAAWLEGAGRWIQAEEIYNMGIQKEARPAARLVRKYNEFQVRLAQQPQAAIEPSSPALPPVRKALGEKIDPFAASSPVDPQAARSNSGVGGASSKSGKSKLQIFSDADEKPPAINEGGKGWDSIGSLADRRKENIIEPKPWAGETLKAGGKKSTAPKMAVFKDESLPKSINPQAIVPKKEQVTVNARSGRQEVIFVNLEAVYPTPEDLGTELSFEELRAFNRGWLNKKWVSEKGAAHAEVSLQEEILDGSAEKMQIFQDEEPERIEVSEKMEVFRELAPSPSKPVKLQIFREEPKAALEPKKQKLQVFAEPEEITNTAASQKSEAVDTIAQEPITDENGAVKVMLDENGNIIKEGREGRHRKIKTMEVNETQIIKANLSSPSGKKKLKRKANAEPTMTFHTKAATDEIYDLFNQPLASEATSDSEASEEDDDDDEEEVEDDGDETDGEYTSGGESTGTGRLLGTSEAGDNTSDAKSVSEWSDFTARKHIPGLEGEEDDDDTRATNLTEEEVEDVGDINETPSLLDTDIENVAEDLVTPTSPEHQVHASTSFVPIPPEEYVAPNRPYRNAIQAAQNRLPFMTPIAEKTESSLGTSTGGRDKDYFNSKTPSKETKSFRATEEMMSSPFQEIINEALPRPKIPQPALSRTTKANLNTAIAKTGISLVKEASKGPIIKDSQCNPVDDYTRGQILEGLNPPLSSYAGYFDNSSTTINRAPELRKFCKAVAKMSKNGADKTMTNLSLPPKLVFPGTEDSYIVKRELGAGAFAPVYLIETISESSDDEDSRESFVLADSKKAALFALKMEDPPTPWEFHITRLALQRIGAHRAADSIINIHSFHLYQDECYLIEEYRDQGTLLDLVNLARADSAQPGGVMDEVLVMWLTTELLRCVEALHAQGILHGDLKADNCLVRFSKLSDTDVWSSRYSRDGSGGWASKGITLIDFGRGIDMRAFRPDVQFIADWKVGPQDCAEMRECRPWTHQIDYHGLAGIVHSLLYGKYMETTVEESKSGGGLLGLGAAAAARRSWKLREPFKRYWQGDIWADVFDLCLNPTAKMAGEESGRMPLLGGMRALRERMEEWLERNCERGVGLQGGIRRLEYLLAQRK